MGGRADLAARLLATFLDELEEQLRALDVDLLTLEREPGDAERLRSVFRVAHTLKGAARAAGVRPIEEVCHALETMCAGARDAGTPLSGAQVALLFAGSDALADAGRRLREGKDAGTSPVITELLQQLRRRAAAAQGHAGRGGVQQGDGPARPPAVPAGLAAVPTDPGETPSVAAQPGAARRSPEDAHGTRATDKPAETSAATAAGPARDDQLRVGARQLDSLITAAGELLGMTGTISDRPAEADAVAEMVRSWRTEWRRATRDGSSRARAAASPVLAAAFASVDDHLARIDQQVGQLARALGDDARTLGGTTARLVDSVRRLRMRPFADIAGQLPRAARDVAVSLGKDVLVTVEGENVEADRTVLDGLREPLLHLVRNAVDHGLEVSEVRRARGKPAEGRIVIRAELGGDRLRVSIADDGAGLDVTAIRAALVERGRAVPADDHDVVRSLFESGFSTRRVTTAISGRGVGLDIVRTAIERFGGTVDVDWEEGIGTTFTIEAPVSVATLRAIIVIAGGQTFAIPTVFVERMVRVPRADVRSVEGQSVLPNGSTPIPLASLASLLGPPLADVSAAATLEVIVLAAAGRRLAIVVDELVEEREIVVRPLEHAGEETSARFSGASLLDGTRVALVVNAGALATTGRRGDARASARFAVETSAARRQWHLLVVDDSITTRTLEESVLSAAGFRVTTAVDGADAWRLVQHGGIDLVVSDVEMPVLDGLGLTEQIRASTAHARLPVILVTSLDKPEHRARGLEAGADAYITKSSFDQDTLIGIVRQLLGEPA